MLIEVFKSISCSVLLHHDSSIYLSSVFVNDKQIIWRLQPPLPSSVQPNNAPPKCQIPVSIPENVHNSARPLLPSPSSLNHPSQSSVSSARVGGYAVVYGSSCPLQRPLGSAVRQGLLDGGDPSTRFSAERLSPSCFVVDMDTGLSDDCILPTMKLVSLLKISLESLFLICAYAYAIAKISH